MPDTTQQPLWKRLKLLVELDQKKEDILSKIKQIEKNIEEDNLMLPELNQTIAQLKKASIDAKKNVDLQELNAKDLKEQESAKRKALDNVTKEKEYAAIEKELNSIVQQASEQDDALVKAWHDLEQAEKKESEQIGELEEKTKLLQDDIVNKKKSISEIKEKLEQTKKDKVEFEKQIPEEWLIKYNRMKGKVKDPIVPVINSSCSSCYYSAPPQDIARLKNNAILPCRSCYRFLYYDFEEEKDTKEASF